MSSVKYDRQNSIPHDFSSIRTVTLWNNLPNYVVAASDVNRFKDRLDNYVLAYIWIWT